MTPTERSRSPVARDDARYVHGACVDDWNPVRCSVSRNAKRLTRRRLVAEVSDVLSGCFMLRRDIFDARVRDLSGAGFKTLVDPPTATPAPLGRSGGSSWTAGWVAIIAGFSLSNLVTYRDRRLRGARWWQGLGSVVLACAVGAVANVGIASYLSGNRADWALAGLAVGAVWNCAATAAFTWGGARLTA